MEQHIYESKLTKISFIIVMLFNCCCFYNGNSSVPSFSYGHWPLKLIFVFLSSFLITLLLCFVERQLDFVGKALMVIMPISAVSYILLSLIPSFAQYPGADGAFSHFIYTMLSVFSSFVAVWILCVKTKNRNIEFAKFYKLFFNGFLPLFIIVFFYVFIISRDYKYNVQTNLIPFNGEINVIIKSINLHSGSFFLYAHTVGNVAFFCAFPLITHRYIGEKYNVIHFIIPCLTSISIECYQYFTHCGDTDIDDVILNCLGAIIGIIIYHTLIKKYLLEGKKCLE